MKKIGLFIDGANTYATGKAIGVDVDYRKLLQFFSSDLVAARYYTAIIPDQESSIIPLVDWLDYNGYTVVRKDAKEFVADDGRRKIKGNMDIEMAVDAIELAFAGAMTDAWLFSGDGDFEPLVHALQRRGVRVTVVSTIAVNPPMIADELRRACNLFIDLKAMTEIHTSPEDKAARAADRPAPGTRRPSRYA